MNCDEQASSNNEKDTSEVLDVSFDFEEEVFDE